MIAFPGHLQAVFSPDFRGLSSFCLRNSVIYLYVVQVLIIREKLAELYESEQQWSKAAQMLSGIDLDSGMRSESKILCCCCCCHYYFCAHLRKL